MTSDRQAVGSDRAATSAQAGPIDAFHLPGLESGQIEDWTESGPQGALVRHPVLDAAALSVVIRRIREARAEYLAGLPMERLTRALAAAAARVVDPGDEIGRTARAALPAITGYSRPMLDLVLDRLAQDWSERALHELLAAEFPRGELESFADRPAGSPDFRATGPEFAFHIFSGNVPGVGVTSIMRSLLVRAATLGKTSGREPLLPALFARALASVDARLADCLAVTHWAGGEASLENEAMSGADVIVVYGAAPTVRSIRARAPVTARLVEHGPRISIGLVGSNALVSDRGAESAATAAAMAVSVFDQQGCVSPHVIWVEGDAATARRFAERLAVGMAAVQATLPRGRIGEGEAAAILESRATAEFRAIAGEDVGVYEGEGTTWTVLFDAVPDFEASCLNRVVRVKPTGSLLDVARLIQPFRGYIQSAAVEGAVDMGALADALAEAGVTRITGFRRMPWPPPTWHHDGNGPLRELVRRVDLEA